jgi:transcriptional regulator with XRE-family HTH domain
MDSATFGARVRAARERLGISQDELATRVSKDQRAISEYETGRRRMFVNDLPLFCEVLQVPYAYFFTETLTEDDLTERLLLEFQQLPDDEARQTAIDLVRRFRKYAARHP